MEGFLYKERIKREGVGQTGFWGQEQKKRRERQRKKQTVTHRDREEVRGPF